MRRLLIYVFILLLSISLFGCTIGEKKELQNTDGQQNTVINEETSPIVYNNTQYGFSFYLPESWKDNKVIIDKWEGLAIGGTQGESVVETGPLISIRHPKWTSENPRQDIPIMVFTISQWDSLQQEKFHIGAAPVGPSELGRNTKYVFALPARYNFAFLTGYEEVEAILQNKPLKPNE